jgi:hypothetical protein
VLSSVRNSNPSTTIARDRRSSARRKTPTGSFFYQFFTCLAKKIRISRMRQAEMGARVESFNMNIRSATFMDG